MIRKALHILIYRNRFFVPLVISICLLIAFLIFSLFNKLELKNNAKNKETYPVSFDFDVPIEAMDRALQVVVDGEKNNLKNLNFVSLISLLAARYGGDWGEYKNSDLNVLVKEFEQGSTENSLAKSYGKDYKAFKNFYESVFKNAVGPFRISKTIDENGMPIFEDRFGLKSYFPIAYSFDATFLDDYEKENMQLSSVHHLGIDVNARLKTPIVSVESGVVKDCGKTRDFGWQVIVQSFDGLRTYYYSNCYSKKPFADGIKPKAVVKAGQVLGYVGATSCCRQKVVRAKNWPHLHFGMSVSLKNGVKQTELFINPYRFLQFLQHHKSVVKQIKGDAGFVNKYEIEDPVFEKYLKKHRKRS